MSDQIDALRALGEKELGIPPSATKPQIRLPGGTVQIRDTAQALYTLAAQKQGLFYRGGTIVRPVVLEGELLASLKVLKAPEARSEFEKYAKFTMVRKGEIRETVMTEDIARAIITSDVAQKILPNISGLINCPLPVLHKGEFHLLEPGYDPKTRFFVTGERIVEPATLEDAVATVGSVFADYTFEDEADISRAIAAILTPALKFGGFISGTIPVEIVEASSSQTGKGFAMLRRAAIYGEIPTTVSKQTGGVGSLDEKFASALVKGRPFILFDNFRGTLDSVLVESFLTSASAFSVRTPGSPESYIDPARFCISITSNGLQTTEDMANRASFIRLTKENAGDFIEIGGKRMLEIIRENQPRFLGAVCKVIRHWHAQGMPKTSDKRHSFTSWAQPLDWIVQNFFNLPPLLDGNREAQDRIQNPHLTFMRLLAIQVEKKRQLDFPLSATALLEICDEASIPVPGIRPGGTYQQQYERQAIGKVMKHFFSQGQTEFAIESYIVTKTEEITKTEAGNTETLKLYRFTKVEDQAAKTT